MAIVVDPHFNDQDASIEEDTTLFRLTSPLYSGMSFLLNGKGANNSAGRYHYIQQPTSYASDNVLLCISEVLYHMSRLATTELANNCTKRQWQSRVDVHKHLVVFKVRKISNLAYIDTDQCRRSVLAGTQEWLAATTVVNPYEIYEPLQTASNLCRTNGHQGIVYPSARHSRDHAVALYGDHTPNLKSIVATLKVRLTLVDDRRSGIVASDPYFNLDRNKLDHTKGRYEIDPHDYTSYTHQVSLRLRGATGYIDFVRRSYRAYPP